MHKESSIIYEDDTIGYIFRILSNKCEVLAHTPICLTIRCRQSLYHSLQSKANKETKKKLGIGPLGIFFVQVGFQLIFFARENIISLLSCAI